MPNHCPHCNLVCPSWFTYQMHLESHRKHDVKSKINLQHKVGIKKPLTEEEKAVLVAKGEARMGLDHFLGYGCNS